MYIWWYIKPQLNVQEVYYERKERLRKVLEMREDY